MRILRWLVTSSTWRLSRPTRTLFVVCRLVLSCFRLRRPCAHCVELGGGLDKPPKNRYEHIHVRFSPAIHGLRHFWEAYPACLQLTSDRKSTRLNSSHVRISYAVFCLKKKTDR